MKRVRKISLYDLPFCKATVVIWSGCWTISICISICHWVGHRWWRCFLDYYREKYIDIDYWNTIVANTNISFSIVFKTWTKISYLIRHAPVIFSICVLIILIETGFSNIAVVLRRKGRSGSASDIVWRRVFRGRRRSQTILPTKNINSIRVFLQKIDV